MTRENTNLFCFSNLFIRNAKQSKTIKKFISLTISLLMGGIMSLQAQYWNTNGNTGADTDFLGTTNAAPLHFKTNNMIKMTLLPVQPFLGIGTTVPVGNLHIHSTYMLRPSFICSNTFQMTNSNTGSSISDGFVIRQYDKKVILQQNSPDLLTIKNIGGGFSIDTEGKIGFGTDIPYQKIHVTGGNILISKGDNASGSGNGSMLFGANIGSSCTYGAWGIEYLNTAEEGYGLNFWKTWDCANGFNYALFLADNGNVGIGVKNPQAKLSVNGKICAKEVKVSLMGSPCWPDYVFSDEYKLLNLEETEQFIKANKHLPNVPSASEVEKEGIELGEMNAILLQKIEELTLYVIDLQKQIDKLNNEKEIKR